MTDGHGIPVGLVVGGANTHDKRLFVQTVERAKIKKPDPADENAETVHICLDRGYDHVDKYEYLIEAGYEVHMAGPKDEAKRRDGASGPATGPGAGWSSGRTRG